MKYPDFVKRVADLSGRSIPDTRDFINCFLNSIMVELVDGGEVWFPGFGRFYVYEKPAKTGVHPQTHMWVEFPSKKFVKFKAGNIISDAVNKNNKEK